MMKPFKSPRAKKPRTKISAEQKTILGESLSSGYEEKTMAEKRAEDRRLAGLTGLSATEVHTHLKNRMTREKAKNVNQTQGQVPKKPRKSVLPKGISAMNLYMKEIGSLSSEGNSRFSQWQEGWNQLSAGKKAEYTRRASEARNKDLRLLNGAERLATIAQLTECTKEIFRRLHLLRVHGLCIILDEHDENVHADYTCGVGELVLDQYYISLHNALTKEAQIQCAPTKQLKGGKKRKALRQAVSDKLNALYREFTNTKEPFPQTEFEKEAVEFVVQGFPVDVPHRVVSMMTVSDLEAMNTAELKLVAKQPVQDSQSSKNKKKRKPRRKKITSITHADVSTARSASFTSAADATPTLTEQSVSPTELTSSTVNAIHPFMEETVLSTEDISAKDNPTPPITVAMANADGEVYDYIQIEEAISSNIIPENAEVIYAEPLDRTLGESAKTTQSMRAQSKKLSCSKTGEVKEVRSMASRSGSLQPAEATRGRSLESTDATKGGQLQLSDANRGTHLPPSASGGDRLQFINATGLGHLQASDPTVGGPLQGNVTTGTRSLQLIDNTRGTPLQPADVIEGSPLQALDTTRDIPLQSYSVTEGGHLQPHETTGAIPLQSNDATESGLLQPEDITGGRQLQFIQATGGVPLEPADLTGGGILWPIESSEGASSQPPNNIVGVRPPPSDETESRPLQPTGRTGDGLPQENKATGEGQQLKMLGRSHNQREQRKQRNRPMERKHGCDPSTKKKRTDDSHKEVAPKQTISRYFKRVENKENK